MATVNQEINASAGTPNLDAFPEYTNRSFRNAINTRIIIVAAACMKLIENIKYLL